MIIYTDGSSANQYKEISPACWRAIIQHDELTEIIEGAGHGTSDEAELKGIIIALHWLIFKCSHIGQYNVEIRTDSKQLVNQLSGSWRIKSNRLTQLINIADICISMLRSAEVSVTFVHINRKHNIAHVKWTDYHSNISVFDGVNDLVEQIGIEYQALANLEQKSHMDINGMAHDINECEPPF